MNTQMNTQVQFRGKLAQNLDQFSKGLEILTRQCRLMNDYLASGAPRTFRDSAGRHFSPARKSLVSRQRAGRRDCKLKPNTRSRDLHYAIAMLFGGLRPAQCTLARDTKAQSKSIVYLVSGALNSNYDYGFQWRSLGNSRGLPGTLVVGAEAVILLNASPSGCRNAVPRSKNN